MKVGVRWCVDICLSPGHHSTYHRNSLEEFLEERRLSSFHFLLPFLSQLRFSSSHLSSGEPMLTGDTEKKKELNSKLDGIDIYHGAA